MLTCERHRRLPRPRYPALVRCAALHVPPLPAPQSEICVRVSGRFPLFLLLIHSFMGFLHSKKAGSTGILRRRVGPE